MVGAKSTRPTVLAALLAIILFATVTALFAAMAKLVPPHSDGACPVLYAQAILDGNIGLRNWDLTTVGFYTELPFYVVGVKTLGVQADVMRYVPAFIYALNVGLIVALIWKYRIQTRLWILLPVLAYLVLPANGVWPHALTPALHHVTASIGYCVLLFLNDRLMLENSRRAWMIAILAAVGTWGDLAFVFLFVLPIGLAGLVFHIYDSENRIQFLMRVFAPLTLGATFGHLAVLWMRAIGFGAPVGIGGIVFETKANVLVKTQLLAESWMKFFGIDVWGLPLSLLTISMCILGFGFVWWVVASIEAVRRNDSAIDLIFVAVPLVTVAATVFSDRGDFLDDTRFLVAPFFLAIVLVSRHLQRIKDPVTLRFAVVLPLLASLCISSWFLNQNRMLLAGDGYASDAKRVSQIIRHRELTQGYGDFWSCQLLRVVSEGTLDIVPLGLSSTDNLIFRKWAADRRWFRNTAGNYAVFKGMARAERKAFSDAAIRKWGKPSEYIELDQWTILIWKNNILKTQFE